MERRRRRQVPHAGDGLPGSTAAELHRPPESPPLSPVRTPRGSSHVGGRRGRRRTPPRGARPSANRPEPRGGCRARPRTRPSARGARPRPQSTGPGAAAAAPAPGRARRRRRGCSVTFTGAVPINGNYERSGPRVAKVADSTRPGRDGGGLQGCPAGTSRPGHAAVGPDIEPEAHPARWSHQTRRAAAPTHPRRLQPDIERLFRRRRGARRRGGPCRGPSSSGSSRSAAAGPRSASWRRDARAWSPSSSRSWRRLAAVSPRRGEGGSPPCASAARPRGSGEQLGMARPSRRAHGSCPSRTSGSGIDPHRVRAARRRNALFEGSRHPGASGPRLSLRSAGR